MISQERCCGCSACVNVCPLNCITMVMNGEGFFIPQIEQNKCLQCHLFDKVCPVEHGRENKSEKRPEVYVGFHQDPEIRLSSSSGGIFTAIAEIILKEQGVVYGAAMRDDCYGVDQVRVTSNEDLHKLRGSKYVQSNVGKTFRQASEDLKNGRQVLYTGTPCQIEGLKSYLGKEYNNLICMDFVCHGVPSEKAWKSYVQLQEKKYGSIAQKASFRDKVTGWKDFSCSIYFEDGQKYSKPFEEDLFGATFVRNADLRKCCYDCAFKKINRVSDITVADAWGIEQSKPEFFDNYGTSLIYVHSAKGKKVLAEIGNKLKFAECTEKECQGWYSGLTHNAEKHPQRDLFYQHIDEMPFDKLVRKYAKPSLKKRIVYVLRKIGLLDFTKRAMKR